MKCPFGGKKKEWPKPTGKKVLAILCGDLHISHRPPLARTCNSWYEQMAYPLQQLREISDHYHVPVVCAGDLFHHWNEPAECINFALRELPNNFYSCCGQHDLANHNIDSIERTAYWSLVEAGKIKNLLPGSHIEVGKWLTLHGFPWGAELKSLPEKDSYGRIHLAVVHKYVWIKGKNYPNAPVGNRAKNILSQLSGYDAIVTGDNHINFQYRNLTNNGCMIRRRADEKQYTPCISALYDDGSMERIPLDTEGEIWLDTKAVSTLADNPIDAVDFLNELNNLGDSVLSFIDTVKRAVETNDWPEGVKRLLLKAIERRE